MAKKIVGYFEGTDPALLTSLLCAGYDTLPIANGYDDHGKHIMLFNAQHKLDLVVGYLHKVVSPIGSETTTREILHTCITYGMPTLLVCPRAHHSEAKELLGDVPDIVSLVDPADLADAANKALS